MAALRYFFLMMTLPLFLQQGEAAELCANVRRSSYSWLHYAEVVLGLVFIVWLYWARERNRSRKGRKPHRTRTNPTRDARPAKPAYDSEQLRQIPRRLLEQSPWWNIPKGTRIFIDTCVLMEAYCDPLVGRWFRHLKQNADSRKWKIVILQSVIKELDGLKNNDSEDCAQAARLATNILNDLQRALGGGFCVLGEYRTPADDEFEREMKKGDVLCTRDNNLLLRINGNRKLQALGLADFPRIKTQRRP